MEEKTRLLIVFIRNPIKGMVKTRLAVDVGEEAALEIYLQLLEHVAEVGRELEVVREVHYSQSIPPNEKEHWQGFIRKLQQGKDLGERMEHAFQQGFHEGYKQIVLIGSDLPELHPDDLRKAFTALDTNEYVLGPAKDGGYYLIGMKSLNSKLFRNIAWSTDTVLQASLEKLKDKSLTLLETRRDLDTYEDLFTFSGFQQYYKKNQ